MSAIFITRRTIAPSAAPPTGLLLDAYPNQVCGFGLRRLETDSRTEMCFLKSSNVPHGTADLLPSGALDEAAIIAKTSGRLNVERWYSQDSQDLQAYTVSSAANRPFIKENNDDFITRDYNGDACVFFRGPSGLTNIASGGQSDMPGNNIDPSGPLHLLLTVGTDGLVISSETPFWGLQTNPDMYFYFENSLTNVQFSFRYGPLAQVFFGALATNTMHRLQVSLVSGVMIAYVNGVQVDSDTYTPLSSANTSAVFGATVPLSNGFNVRTFACWQQDLSSQAANIDLLENVPDPT